MSPMPVPQELPGVQDAFGRPLRSLRLSVTDRCNLRCKYCMPEDEYAWLPRETLLTFEEMNSLTGLFTELGVDKVRLTGGEPLLRKDLGTLIRLLLQNSRIQDLALTTNGILLAEQAQILYEAGLHRITVSLDTLQPERFRALTKRDMHRQVLEGIEAVGRSGFKSLKLDTVAIRGFNEDELANLIEYGKRVRAEPDAPFSLIIGVARDAQTSRVGEVDPLFLYVPFQPRHYNRELGVLVRTSGDAREMASLAQAEIRALDPTPWVTTSSLEEKIANSESANITRVASMLSAGLGLLALVLAAVGIYGVMSYAVSKRTHEIGIRMALGAQKTAVLMLVIRQGLTLTLVGMAIGSLAALALTRLLKSLLFGVSASDPLTYVGVGVLFAGVALMACYLPARRATKVDPMVALRCE